MDIEQIESALQDIFAQPLIDGEQRKIVFWVDKDKEFIDDVDQLTLDGIQVQKLTTNNQFRLKFVLEVEDSTSNYLIYTNLELGLEDNWLADTVLYSKIFYADRLSLLLNELGIAPSLRGTIKKYERFFRNKERYRKFQALAIESFNGQMIELAIMSVLCNVKVPDFEEVLKVILMDTLEDNENKYLGDINKYFDVDVFWKYVAEKYGYDHPAKTLKTLFMHLSVTAFSHSVKGHYLTSLKDFIAARNRTNCLVFIDHWMHHKTDYKLFDEYAEMVEDEVQLSHILQAIPIEEFKKAETFPQLDRAIIIYLANSLFEKLEDFEEYKKLIKLRRSKHFYDQYENVYEALYYTIEMQAFYKEYQHGIPIGKTIDIYEAYQNKYHLMDTYYRKFYVAYDKENNHEILKKLKEMVEHLYVHWFTGELGTIWSQAVRSDLKEQWSLPGVLNQQQFYTSIVSPHIRKGERVFVIISDAFRYEVGSELAARLNADTIGTCDIQSMLGVLPSVTKLGMAALLPHKSIDFNLKGQVLVDGKDSAGLQNRKSIIESSVEDSTAVHFHDIIRMNKAGRREAFKGKKLIYIYHDSIDAMGDKASTEIQTFDAAEKALSELSLMIKIIRDDLSGTNIYITADHGFLYQRDPLEESDKIEKVELDAIEIKRRYALSRDKQEVPGQTMVNLSSITSNEQKLNVYVPNGNLRNRMQGTGVNFNHGGASLQEIVVPLLSFKNKRAGQKGVQAITKVDIKLTSTTQKITNSIFTLNFFQTEKVEEKTKPRTVVIYMADEEGNVLSNEETIIGDRSFENPADRTFKIQFVLKSISYDRNKTYYLQIKDTETGVITERVPFNINLGIVGDFDF